MRIRKMGLLLLVQLLMLAPLLAQKKKADAVLTADSLATGNYKDVLTSFFQLAFDNLTGKDKQLKFTSNPFAIMMRANPDLIVDTNYQRFRTLRNLNFGFNVKLDSNYKFNGFASGVNFAIINKRDYTVYKEFLHLVRANNEEYEILNKAVGATMSRLADPVLMNTLREQTSKLLNDKNFNYSKLDAQVKPIIDSIIKANNLVRLLQMINRDANVNIAQTIASEYEGVKESFKKRALWTVGVSDTTYADQFLFSNVVFSSQFLKGVYNKSNHNLELDLRGAYNLINDTLLAGRDLKRGLLNVEGGLNYVWRSQKTDLSFLEFKMSAAYMTILNGLYPGERKELFTLNGTLRIRVIDDVWVPVQFKYDPKTGNVFGLLNVKVNFSALKKAFIP